MKKVMFLMVAGLVAALALAAPAQAGTEVWGFPQDGPIQKLDASDLKYSSSLNVGGIPNGFGWNYAGGKGSVFATPSQQEVWLSGGGGYGPVTILNPDGTFKSNIDAATPNPFATVLGLERRGSRMIVAGQTSTSQGGVAEYLLDGTLVKMVVAQGTVIPGLGGAGNALASISGLGVDANGKIYLTVRPGGVGKVLRFAANGTFELQNTLYTTEPNDLLYVTGSGAQAGNLLLSCNNCGDIRSYNPATLTNDFGVFVSQGSVSSVQMIMEGDNILIAQTKKDVIERFDQLGNSLDTSFFVAGATNFRGVYSALPEPSTIALLGLGGLMMLRRRRS
jgi:hypothetical protein